MKEIKQIAVVGAGLVGCVQALLLAKRGYSVKLFERRSDPRKTDPEVGRSINLALSHRGIQALKKLELEHLVPELSTSMYGRMIHNADGSEVFQPYGKTDQCIHSISRINFNKALLDACDESEKISVFFDAKCVEIDLAINKIEFESAELNKNNTFDKIFGTDGSYSMVRQSLLKNGRYDFTQKYLDHGYKELTIPAKDGEYALDPKGLHIWPRGSFMLIALPNKDKSFTCTLFLPFEGKSSFDKLKDAKRVRAFFNHTFPEASYLMPNLEAEFFENPTSSLVMIQCYPWGTKDVLLLGDAAHAIVPFYGQGMNCGLEDCLLFFEMLADKEDDWNENLFEEYAEFRKPNADAILKLSLDNYLEMRDSTANPRFLLRKKIERRLSERHPELWRTLYSMVTFSSIPYAEVYEQGQKQSKIMDEIMLKPNIEVIWDSEELENEILEHLSMNV